MLDLRHYGAIAQPGERLHGMQEVSGSIPLSSTKYHGLTKLYRISLLYDMDYESPHRLEA